MLPRFVQAPDHRIAPSRAGREQLVLRPRSTPDDADASRVRQPVLADAVVDNELRVSGQRQHKLSWCSLATRARQLLPAESRLLVLFLRALGEIAQERVHFSLNLDYKLGF